MFKEAYIRDNDRIKPDEAFLERLKETVIDEKVVRIDEYVAVDEKKDRTKVKKRHITKIRNVASLVACLLLFCVSVFYIGKQNVNTGDMGLETDAGMIFDNWKSKVSDTSDEEIQVSDTCQKQYDMLYEMFQNQNVRIYPTIAFDEEEFGVQKIQKLVEQVSELERNERDNLVANILAERYILVENEMEFSSKEYYVAEFEDGVFAALVIGDGQYVFVKALTGMQSLAHVK